MLHCPSLVLGGCGWTRPSCTIELRPPRSWGGFGNLLPIHASLAASSAFARNCTSRFNESRAFQVGEHWRPPVLIPRGWRPDGSGYHPSCPLRAITSRPSPEVSARIDHIQARLVHASVTRGDALPRSLHPCLREASFCCSGRSSSVTSAERRSSRGSSAIGSQQQQPGLLLPSNSSQQPQQHRRLVGLQIRSLWADARLHAAPYHCSASLTGSSSSTMEGAAETSGAADTAHSAAEAAADELLALILAPDFASPAKRSGSRSSRNSAGKSSSGREQQER